MLLMTHVAPMLMYTHHSKIKENKKMQFHTRICVLMNESDAEFMEVVKI